jgi:hypothetical protein
MMKSQFLIKVSTKVQQNWRQAGQVEYIVERYADPKKPNVTKLWVVNGEHEFKRQRDYFTFTSRLCDEIGGLIQDGALAEQNFSKVIKSYSEELAAAVLG